MDSTKFVLAASNFQSNGASASLVVWIVSEFGGMIDQTTAIFVVVDDMLKGLR